MKLVMEDIVLSWHQFLPIRFLKEAWKMDFEKKVRKIEIGRNARNACFRDFDEVQWWIMDSDQNEERLSVPVVEMEGVNLSFSALDFLSKPTPTPTPMDFRFWHVETFFEVFPIFVAFFTIPPKCLIIINLLRSKGNTYFDWILVSSFWFLIIKSESQETELNKVSTSSCDIIIINIIGKNQIEDSRFFHILKKRAFLFFFTGHFEEVDTIYGPNETTNETYRSKTLVSPGCPQKISMIYLLRFRRYMRPNK